MPQIFDYLSTVRFSNIGDHSFAIFMQYILLHTLGKNCNKAVTSSVLRFSTDVAVILFMDLACCPVLTLIHCIYHLKVIVFWADAAVHLNFCACFFIQLKGSLDLHTLNDSQYCIILYGCCPFQRTASAFDTMCFMVYSHIQLQWTSWSALIGLCFRPFPSVCKLVF